MEAVPELFVKAPPLEIPVPFNDSASVAALVNEKPFKSRTAPLVTEVPKPVVPNGPAVLTDDETPNFNVPTPTVVVPV